jgi:hypothetical protein
MASYIRLVRKRHQPSHPFPIGNEIIDGAMPVLVYFLTLSNFQICLIKLSVEHQQPQIPLEVMTCVLCPTHNRVAWSDVEQPHQTIALVLRFV